MHPEGETEGPSIEAQMHDALATIFMDHNNSMLNRFVVITEVIEEDGERGLWTFTSPDAKRWEIEGMIKDASDFQTAHRVVEILEEHGHAGH